MIGIDTNVLVRYVTQDDPKQSASATRLFDELTEASPGHLNVVVLAELHWVLTRAYAASPADAAEVIRRLLGAREIVVQHADAVRDALQRVDVGADFADALVHALGVLAKCTATVTFDRAAARSAGMQLLR